MRGTDVLFGKWSLLFATPFYQVTLPEHEALNTALLNLLDTERRSLPSGTAGWRSVVGNGWPTDDGFLQRSEAPIRKLHRLLLEHSRRVVQYGQNRKLDLELHLSGWAVSLGSGGRQTEHVHPHASWSGVYYVRGGGAGTNGGGCLRVTDPRPAAMMVTLGPNDAQFIEARQICPKTGLLVLFPAWLSHGVTPVDPETNEAEGETRVAVAFNVHGAERGLR